jgi:hypothetical protein
MKFASPSIAAARILLSDGSSLITSGMILGATSIEILASLIRKSSISSAVTPLL